MFPKPQIIKYFTKTYPALISAITASSITSKLIFLKNCETVLFKILKSKNKRKGSTPYIFSREPKIRKGFYPTGYIGMVSGDAIIYLSSCAARERGLRCNSYSEACVVLRVWGLS